MGRLKDIADEITNEFSGMADSFDQQHRDTTGEWNDQIQKRYYIQIVQPICDSSERAMLQWRDSLGSLNVFESLTQIMKE